MSAGTPQSVARDDSSRHAERGARYRVRASPSRRRARLYRMTRAPAYGVPESVMRVTPAHVDVNGPAVLRDTRGCPRGQAHLSSMTDAPTSDVGRPFRVTGPSVTVDGCGRT